MARPTPASRRYLIRVAAAMAVYLVSLFAADYLIEDLEVSGPLAWVLAVIPGLATAALFWAVGMFIVETRDEFLRMLMVRQQLIATGFAMSVACVWGFLEEFHLVGHVEAFWIVVLWAVGQPIGMIFNRATHGTSGECP